MPGIEAQALAINADTGLFEQAQCFHIATDLDADFRQQPFGMVFEADQRLLIE
jgi:hypothetical protein